MVSDSKALLSAPLQGLCEPLGASKWMGTLRFSPQLQKAAQLNVKRKTSRLYCIRMSQEKFGDIFESIPEYLYPQNLDLPPILPIHKKRPYVRPIKLVLRESRRRKKLGLIPNYWDAPRNGMLVEKLIPVAYQVMEQLAVLEEGVKKLMEVVPVQACSCCSDIHIGDVGHLIRSCRGSGNAARKGYHVWIKGHVQDVLVPTECYHVLDRLGPPIIHDQRFSVPRVCAITELCIQAGYEHPDYPVVRWARISGRQTGRGRAQVPETKLLRPYTDYLPRHYNTMEAAEVQDKVGKLPDEGGNAEEEEEGEAEKTEGEAIALAADLKNEEHTGEYLFDPKKDELVATAERTLNAFQGVRKGVQMLMKKYVVKACGYCPEIHVGQRGHRVKICGAFKHQQRQGKHGWQEAALGDIFPPNFVWHVPAGHSAALRAELRSYYGQAPAVVELCVHAGARVPQKWKPFMRTDVVIPDVDEKSVAC